MGPIAQLQNAHRYCTQITHFIPLASDKHLLSAWFYLCLCLTHHAPAPKTHPPTHHPQGNTPTTDQRDAQSKALTLSFHRWLFGTSSCMCWNTSSWSQWPAEGHTHWACKECKSSIKQVRWKNKKGYKDSTKIFYSGLTSLKVTAIREVNCCKENAAW